MRYTSVSGSAENSSAISDWLQGSQQYLLLLRNTSEPLKVLPLKQPIIVEQSPTGDVSGLGVSTLIDEKVEAPKIKLKRSPYGDVNQIRNHTKQPERSHLFDSKNNRLGHPYRNHQVNDRPHQNRQVKMMGDKS